MGQVTGTSLITHFSHCVNNLHIVNSFSHLTRSILKMEELDNREPPTLNSHDGSDNESLCSNDPDITQSFSRLDSEIKQEMSSIATQI